MPRLLSRAFLIRFLFLLVIALVPLLLGAALGSAPAADLSQEATRTANELDRLLQMRMRGVFTIAAFPSIRAFTSSTPETRSQRAAAALNELQAWVAADPKMREAFIVDPGGTVIMATSQGWNTNIGSRAFVRDALAGQLAVSPVVRDRNEYSMYYAAPVLNNNKEISGALVARLDAQELWDTLPSGAAWFTVLGDENGVRLADSGDPARRLMAFAPLSADLQTRVLNETTYGAQNTILRASNFPHAQDLWTRGALNQLQPSDVGAGALAYQRLLSKPWYVLALSPQSPWVETAARLVVPVLTAFILAFVGALVLTRP